MATGRRLYAEGYLLMSFENTEDLADLAAPYGKELKLQEVTYEGGMRLLRLRIKEGKRFTTLDLDPNTIASLMTIFKDWHDKAEQ